MVYNIIVAFCFFAIIGLSLSESFWCWFKKVFGKRDWEIVYTVQCKLNRTDILSGLNVKTDGAIIIKVDQERKIYKCYMTDGVNKNKISIDYVIAHNNTNVLKEVLNTFKFIK